MLDRTQASEPVRVQLLSGVRTVTFRFMYASRRMGRSLAAAAAATPADGSALRPAAVEVTLELEDWGTIRRIVEVAG